VATAVALCALLSGGAAAPSALAAAPVNPAVETDTVAHSGDAADDPAFWFDPADARRSMIIGTDKRGALETYDLAGHRLQRIDGIHPNNVDVRGDVVVAADDETGDGVLRVYRVGHQDRRLTALAVIPTRVTAHGICLYTSPRSGTLYAFPNSISGRVEQWELIVTGRHVRSRSVRLFDAGGPVEGCVADDATGQLYLAQERRGIWRYGAEPGAGTTRVLVDSTSAGHLHADVEGLAIAGDRLYASSQGSSDFTVYQRVGNRFLGRFRVTGHGAVDGCEDTDGIDATTRPLGPAFPAGLFVCQDGYNLNRAGLPVRQNFKLVPLQRAVGAVGVPVAPVRPEG
jgi:3-phytase